MLQLNGSSLLVFNYLHVNHACISLLFNLHAFNPLFISIDFSCAFPRLYMALRRFMSLDEPDMWQLFSSCNLPLKRPYYMSTLCINKPLKKYQQSLHDNNDNHYQLQIPFLLKHHLLHFKTQSSAVAL